MELCGEGREARTRQAAAGGAKRQESRWPAKREWSDLRVLPLSFLPTSPHFFTRSSGAATPAQRTARVTRPKRRGLNSACAAGREAPTSKTQTMADDDDLWAQVCVCVFGKLQRGGLHR